MTYGSTPQYNSGLPVPGQKRLYHSDPEFALIKDKTIQPGFGILTVGTVMATNAISGDLLPYVTDTHTDDGVGRAYGVADVASATNEFFCTIEDAFKFTIGDGLVLVRDNAGAADYHDGGAITAIDTTTETHRAKITFTTAIAAVTTFSTANKVNAYTKTDAAGKFSKATWILDQDVDTGTGEKALGANCSVVISNAMLYKSSMVGYDSTAATAMSIIEDGQHLILK